jgi:hypothetical protein
MAAPSANPQTRGTNASPMARAEWERKGLGPTLALLILPILCCGGPAIVATLAAVSAVTLGVAGGLLGAALLMVAGALWRRHRPRSGACCDWSRQERSQ